MRQRTNNILSLTAVDLLDQSVRTAFDVLLLSLPLLIITGAAFAPVH